MQAIRGFKSLAATLVVAGGLAACGTNAGSDASSPAAESFGPANSELPAYDGERASPSGDFCGTLKRHKDRFEEAMAAAQSTDALSGLVATAATLGDIKLMWSDLADVAPEEIRTDVRATRDAWKTSEALAGNADGLGSLANALFNANSAARVNEYIIEQCGDEYAPIIHRASPAPTTQSSPVKTVLLDKTFEDEDGYKYRVVLDGPATYTPTVDTAGARPGKALVRFVLQTTGRLYNMTAARNAPFPTGTIAGAVWQKPGLACTSLGEGDNADLNNVTCGRTWQVGTTQTEIPMEGSVDFGVTIGNVFEMEVAESKADAVKDAFSKPIAWYVATGIVGLASAAKQCVASKEGIC